MATQVLLSIARGARDLKDTTVAAGTPIGNSDAMQLNIDINKISKGDALVMLEQFRMKIFQGKWPPVIGS
jgi:hypothetical protein